MLPCIKYPQNQCSANSLLSENIHFCSSHTMFSELQAWWAQLSNRAAKLPARLPINSPQPVSLQFPSSTQQSTVPESQVFLQTSSDSCRCELPPPPPAPAEDLPLLPMGLWALQSLPSWIPAHSLTTSLRRWVFLHKLATMKGKCQTQLNSKSLKLKKCSASIAS